MPRAGRPKGPPRDTKFVAIELPRAEKELLELCAGHNFTTQTGIVRQALSMWWSSQSLAFPERALAIVEELKARGFEPPSTVTARQMVEGPPVRRKPRKLPG